MSLTNPEKVVTEQRLAEFYQQILPYLGGMPDLMANKFNRSDLYSTDEKIVGQWTDGKPLYQKTLSGTTGAMGADSNFGAIANVETLVSIDGVCTTYANLQQGVPCPGLYVKFQNGSVMTYTNADGFANKACTVTLNYTKTTDSAVAIGSDTDYSTTEKIIGTWIDGKPIYQKTVSCGALPNNTTKNVAHGITNASKFISVSAYTTNGTNYMFLNHPYEYFANVICNATNVMLRTNTNLSAYTETYVTIQYTKTSD